MPSKVRKKEIVALIILILLGIFILKNIFLNLKTWDRLEKAPVFYPADQTR